ncbi:hypothetical protein [[Phormidium] sp. ETS-05]|uniref:hypothetical protein n=1 Tax=[Phormidium] sp. ETS-05 TaxID=222819 RepID=UPI0018EF0F98|nr:hypothetical protein [[Phormidium] sp. ETS-05]
MGNRLHLARIKNGNIARGGLPRLYCTIESRDNGRLLHQGTGNATSGPGDGGTPRGTI